MPVSGLLQSRRSEHPLVRAVQPSTGGREASFPHGDAPSSVIIKRREIAPPVLLSQVRYREPGCGPQRHG
jgi:hypothetical protein